MGCRRFLHTPGHGFPSMRLLALVALAFVPLSGCSSILSDESGYCGKVDEVQRAIPGPFYTVDSISTPDGFEWSSDSGGACSKQHVSGSVDAVSTTPPQGCAAITGIEARLQASGGFPYGPYAGSSQPLSGGKTSWRASVNNAGLAQSHEESDSVTFSVSVRILYPKTGDEVKDAACVDNQLEELRILYSYKSYKP